MKNLFNYCFYRIAFFYKKHIPLEDYLGQGIFLQLFADLLYVLSLIALLLGIVGIKFTKEIAIIFLIPFVILTIFMNRLFPNQEQLFEEMSLKYQQEKGRWIKGFLVFLYIIMSLPCFMMVLFAFKK